MIRALILSTLLAMGIAQAQAATLQATPATLSAVARTAQACDVVAVTGPATSLQLYGNAFPVSQACPWGVTLDLSSQSLNYFTASKVSNLKVKGGAFAANDWHGAVNIGDFANVSVEGITQVSGATGVLMRGGTGASVQNNTLTGGNVYIENVTGFDVGGNTSIGAASDGFDVAGSHQGRVHHNACVAASPQNGAHPDCVQVFNAPPLSDYIEIDHNQAAGPTQAFDVWGGGAHIWAHDNTSMTASVVVAIDGCASCAATDNHGYTPPGAPLQYGQIDARESPKAILCGNSAEAYATWAAVKGRACTATQHANAAKLVVPPAAGTPAQ